MTPMRIVHVIRNLDPATGGPPVICWNTAKAQAANGHSVSVIVEVAAASLPEAEGVAVRPVGVCGFRERLFPGTVSRRIRESLRDAEVVHMHGVWENLLVAVGREARRLGIPYLQAPHGMLDPWNLSQKKWKKRIALALGTRRLLRGNASIHQTYREERQSQESVGVYAPGIVVPNGVTLAEIDPLPSPAEFRATLPALGGSPYILFLSRLHHKKGLDYLADAFALLAPRFPALQLVVAGKDDGVETPFREQCRRLGIESRVHLVGPVYGRRKWAALAGAACFCLPSRQEGFSVAVLEALACACPVVISDQCHFPEVAEAGAGIVVPLDPAAIAGGLEAVVADPSRGAEMGRAGRRLVERHYTWERIATDLVETYRRLASGSR